MKNGDSSKSALEKWRERKKNESAKKEVIVKHIEPLKTTEPSPLSHGQERLWLLEQLYPNQSLYTYAHRYQIEGEVDIDLFEKSLKRVIERHEILRTVYKERTERVLQVVLDDFNLAVDTYDYRSTKNESLESIIQSFVSKSFDLANDIPIRLLTIKQKKSVDFVIALHHIAGDAWSMNIINTELSAIYKALSENKEPTLHDVPIQYNDFAFWQRQKSINLHHLGYWKKQLEGELEVLVLTKTKRAFDSFEGKSLRLALNNTISSEIADLAQKLQVTPFTLMLTAFNILLGKYTDAFDQVIGTPLSNRDLPDLEKLVGFFNETFVIRSKIKSGDRFTEALDKVNRATLEALANKDITFDTLVNEIQPDRAAGENPLFQAMFLYTDSTNKLTLGDDIDIQEKVLDTGVSKFDLTLFINKASDHLTLTFEYSTAIDDKLIENMAAHFQVLLKEIIKTPSRQISQLSVLSKEEFNHLIFERNKTEIALPKLSSIQEFIEKNNKGNLSSTAISTSKNSISYAQLHHWSDQLAIKLQDAGLVKNEFVGLFTNRSIEMIVGILGILKAGGAYLPLDPEYPEDRIEFMLTDSSCNYILFQNETEKRLPNNQLKSILIDCDTLDSVKSDKNPVTKNQWEDFAYLIYTSGSSGKPKGVPITHGQLIHSTVARQHYYQEELNAFLLLSSFSFDSSVAGIFWTLCSGGTLVLPPERIEQDIHQLSSLIKQHEVTHTLLLPSLYQVILSLSNAALLQSLKVVIVAGEACPTSLSALHKKSLPHSLLYNEYGPTEATVWCIAHKIETTDQEQSIPIGKPIANSSAYILDQDMNPIPEGMTGELYIGGLGVSNGYLGRPDLTQSKFLKNPFNTEELTYKTGDKARYTSDGNIEFLGRLDEQVKLRGFRIELSEIKQVLLDHESVQDAFIDIASSENEKQLISYIVCDKETVKDIMEHARRQLPSHMIPQLIPLESFPKLPNGKLDKSKLPDVQNIQPDPSEYEAPQTNLEKKLAEIWIGVLKVDDIDVNSNFFEIGGDSIRSIQVVSKARSEGIDIEATALFRYQSIRQLADYLETPIKESHINQETGWVSTIPMKTSGEKAPLFCLHSGGAHVMFYREFALNIEADHPVYAIQPKGLENDQDYDESITEMAANYIIEIKKIQPKGPYHLLGTCFSNAVGLEMLHQLKASDDEVAAFFIIDSAPAFLSPPSPNGEKMPVRRLLSLVRNGEFDIIKKKLRNRYIRLNKKINADSTSQVEKDLDEMIESLNSLYANYTWKPIQENFILIRSSEFAQKKTKQFHIDHWTKLSKKNLKIEETPGHHLTLFRQPEVLGLAEIVSSKLNELHR